MIVSFIQMVEPNMTQGRLRTGGRDVIVPAGQVTWVRCWVPSTMNLSNCLVLFEADEGNQVLKQLDVLTGLVEIQNQANPYVTIALSNNTKHVITLTRKTALGTLQPVECIVEAETPNGSQPSVTVREVTVEPAEPLPTSWHPPVNLDHLEERQKEMVEKMQLDECRVFTRDGNDIGCNPDHKMVINLKDDIPVRRAYTSILKPLLREVKKYVQDLLVKGWIVRSKSFYAASIMCMRKKDGSLCLFIDYFLLNQKTVPDRHPVPQIRDPFDTLGGNS